MTFQKLSLLLSSGIEASTLVEPLDCAVISHQASCFAWWQKRNRLLKYYASLKITRWTKSRKRSFYQWLSPDFFQFHKLHLCGGLCIHNSYILPHAQELIFICYIHINYKLNICIYIYLIFISWKSVFCLLPVIL